MALLDQVLAQMGGPAAGALAKAAMSNPKLLQAGLSMLSNQQGSIGGPGGLASLLPELVNHLTPSGQVPDAGSPQGTIGSLLGALGK